MRRLPRTLWDTLGSRKLSGSSSWPSLSQARPFWDFTPLFWPRPAFPSSSDRSLSDSARISSMLQGNETAGRKWEAAVKPWGERKVLVLERFSTFGSGLWEPPPPPRSPSRPADPLPVSAAWCEPRPCGCWPGPCGVLRGACSSPARSWRGIRLLERTHTVAAQPWWTWSASTAQERSLRPLNIISNPVC